MVNPQQPELRRNNRGTTSQDSKVPGPGRPRHGGTSNADAGRTVPKGQVSPHGPAGKPVADDESGRRG